MVATTHLFTTEYEQRVCERLPGALALSQCGEGFEARMYAGVALMQQSLLTVLLDVVVGPIQSGPGNRRRHRRHLAGKYCGWDLAPLGAFSRYFLLMFLLAHALC